MPPRMSKRGQERLKRARRGSVISTSRFSRGVVGLDGGRALRLCGRNGASSSGRSCVTALPVCQRKAMLPTPPVAFSPADFRVSKSSPSQYSNDWILEPSDSRGSNFPRSELHHSLSRRSDRPDCISTWSRGVSTEAGWGAEPRGPIRSIHALLVSVDRAGSFGVGAD